MTHSIDDNQRAILAKNIRRFRDELGLTQSEFAERANVVLDSVRAYEHAIRLPSLRALQGMADACGRSIADFTNPNPPEVDPAAMKGIRRFKIIGELDDDLREKIDTFVAGINDEQLRRVAELKKAGRKGRKL